MPTNPAPEPARGPARPEPRRHTGRRRSEEARQAILDATFRLLGDGAGESLTIDAIAAEAGVGRQTIYRWWPGKGAVVAEAMAAHARAMAEAPDTGTLRGDLEAFLTDTFAAASDPGHSRLLRHTMADAQRDAHVREQIAEFTAGRREVLGTLLERGRTRGELPADADRDVLTDLAYGFLWYRLLVGHAPLDAAAARDLTAHLMAASTI